MNIKTVFCDNWFPPIVIECMKFGNGKYQNKTDYRVPVDGKYQDYVFGIWKVKYKTINENYYCQGQKQIKNEK